MRWIIYLAGLAVIVFFIVALGQVLMRRMTDRDLVRKSRLKEEVDARSLLEKTVNEVYEYARNQVVINDTDITALNVLRIIQEKERE